MTNSHKQRWITAVIVLPFLLTALLMGGWVLLGAAVIVSTLGQYEFYSMFWPGRSNLFYKLAGCLLGAGLLYASFIGNPYAMTGCIAAGFWVGSLGFLFAFGTGRTDAPRFEQAQILTAGMLYLPLLIQTVLHLSTAEVVLILFAAFASDIGGFYAGCNFGRHKMWPSVSPKKTWEGAAGGMIFCVAICLAVGLSFGSASWPAWVVLGIILNVSSQVGDYFESALKRTLDIKDSGTLLPGHGGILDRIDSILLALPVYALARSVHTFF